jgi:hypothetical protein
MSLSVKRIERGHLLIRLLVNDGTILLTAQIYVLFYYESKSYSFLGETHRDIVWKHIGT